MRIDRFSFKNKELGWEVEPIEFKQLNLLVGLSASGKSQILNALWSIKNIALGKEMSGVEWSIDFFINQENYKWKGRFNLKEERTGNFWVLDEKIINLSTNQFIERKENSSLIINDPINKKFEEYTGFEAGKGLIFNVYKHNFIEKAIQGFKKMVLRDHTLSQANIDLNFYKTRFRFNSKQYGNYTIEDLLKGDFTTAERLLIADKNKLEEVTAIEEEFKQFFPQVTKLFIDEVKNSGQESGHIEYRIKVRGNDKFVPHWNISSGMLRTLNYLVELNLADQETVFLIDEFENSLGHNCLPRIAEDILQRSAEQQFIVTSHHPDIIDAFDMSCWKVISRKNGKITNKNVEDLPFNRSQHEPYLALINHFETQDAL